MYVIKNYKEYEDEFLQQINKLGIETGSDIQEAMIFDDIDLANKILEYVTYYEDYKEFIVVKICYEKVGG